MPPPKPAFYISATRPDLEPTREIVRAALLDLGAEPVELDYAATGGQTVADVLHETVSACHGVIHLIGDCAGPEDENSSAAREHLTYADGRRSYAQLEHDLAKTLRKSRHVFVCGENFPYTPHPPEPEEMQRLQADHRAQLLGGGLVVHKIDQPADVRTLILQIKVRRSSRHKRSTSGKPSRPSSLLDISLTVVGLLLLVALAGGAWWYFSRTSPDGDGGSTRRGGDPNDLAPFTTPGNPNASADPNRPMATPVPAFSGWFESQHKLASVHFQKGKFPEAITTLTELLAATEQERGPDDPLTLIAAHSLGCAKHELFKDPDAVPLLRRALAGRTKVLGPEHADTIASMAELGNTLVDMGDTAAAEPLLKEAMALSERVLGPDHAFTFQRINRYAALLKLKGDLAGAEPLFQRIADESEKTFGATDPRTLMSLNNYAQLLRAKGDIAGAEPIFRRALKGQEQTLGADHLSTCITAQNLAEMLIENGKTAAAKPFALQAYRGFLKAGGPDHERTRATRELVVRTGEKPD